MNSTDCPSQQQYPRAAWRVIIHRAADGATNMAIDESIAEHVGAGLVLPTLRFYAWEPACLSLGYAQPSTDVDFECIKAQGWDVVRRLTGGRAILHTDELTYSIATPVDEQRVAGGVIGSYRRLSAGLALGIRTLGATAEARAAMDGSQGINGPVCFEVPSDYEITAHGRKLLGSAQTRRAGRGVLQHGTLPLYGDLGRVCDVLVFDGEHARVEARRRVLERAITLEDVLGTRVTFEEAVEALRRGLAQALNLDFEMASLSASEQARTKALREQKYASELWTKRH